MKLFIASDIHGSAACTRLMLEAFEREQADKMLLLGDILYHGPRNDLPELYEPKKAFELLNGYKDRILCVRGNCDSEVDQMVLAFPIMAEYALIEADGHSIFATHGHHFNKHKLPPLGLGNILLHGHTHIPAWEDLGNGLLYLNPGSVSIPKGGSSRGYMTYEQGKFTWKNLDGDTIHELVLYCQ